MPSCSSIGCTNRSQKIKNISFHRVPSEKRNKELRMKWLQSIERAGKLPSDGGFFICDSHFDESCFERDLKVIILAISFKISLVPF